jgi:hypothetical protein
VGPRRSEQAFLACPRVTRETRRGIGPPKPIDHHLTCTRPVNQQSANLFPALPAPVGPGIRAAASPEIELLLCCARTYLAPPAVERVRILVRDGIDWAGLVEIARAQRLTPLLYASLCSTCSEAVPSPVLDGMRDYCGTTLLKNLLLTRELLELVVVFESAGVPMIPAKGPLLAMCVYGTLEVRPFNDLDLLVSEPDVPRARELLLARGYVAGWSDSDWERKFEHPDRGIAIDLHHRIAPRHFPAPASFKAMWHDRRPVPCLNTTVLGMAPEHLLLWLSVDLARDCLHRKPRMLQVCDVAELIRAHPRLDCERVGALARAAGGGRILLVALQLARSLLGVEPPRGSLEALRADRVVHALAARVRPQLLRASDAAGFRALDSAFYLRARERLTDKLRYVSIRALGPARLLVTPTESDRRFVRLPPALALLYYVVRPIRILRDRVMRKKRRVRGK